jgi:hypothetical protein
MKDEGKRTLQDGEFRQGITTADPVEKCLTAVRKGKRPTANGCRTTASEEEVAAGSRL